MKKNDIRDGVIEQFELLSKAEAQLEYEKSVPHASVVAELSEVFCSDLFHPKSPDFIDTFSEEELKDLAVCVGGSLPRMGYQPRCTKAKVFDLRMMNNIYVVPPHPI